MYSLRLSRQSAPQQSGLWGAAIFVSLRRSRADEALFVGEARARQGLGIWKDRGAIQQLPIDFNPHDLISIAFSDTIVVNGTGSEKRAEGT